jgi:hypothetical protein
MRADVSRHDDMATYRASASISAMRQNLKYVQESIFLYRFLLKMAAWHWGDRSSAQ